MTMTDVQLHAALTEALPVTPCAVDLPATRFGLVIVDEVNGFCTVGAGPLAPVSANGQVERMVHTTDRLARATLAQDAPVLALLDTHEPSVPEPPYPPHCERGTGQENLVPELAWLETAAGATLLRKDCINGFIGGIDRNSGQNRVVEWCDRHGLSHVVVTGICTDICVLDFVVTLLSARNHGLLATLREVVVFTPATATYDLPRAAADAASLPPSATHPQMATHHVGLYIMAARGAVLAERLPGLLD